MPNSHKESKRGVSARVEPDVRDNLHALARLNGTDLTGLMIMLAEGRPLKYPDGSSVWDKISGSHKGEK